MADIAWTPLNSGEGYRTFQCTLVGATDNSEPLLFDPKPDDTTAESKDDTRFTAAIFQVGAAPNGGWQYRLDGTNWINIGANVAGVWQTPTTTAMGYLRTLPREIRYKGVSDDSGLVLTVTLVGPLAYEV